MNYDYWFWENVISKKEILFLNNFIEKNFDCFEDVKFHAKDKNNKSKKNTLVMCISFYKIKETLKKIIHNYNLVNQKHFGYDLYPQSDLSHCNLNVYSYKKNQSYGWHNDSSTDKYEDIKLTVLINISKKTYKGGNFYIFNQDEYEVKELNIPGNMIMFKSYLSHKVTPVTEGERRTLAIFLCGPKLR